MLTLTLVQVAVMVFAPIVALFVFGRAVRRDELKGRAIAALAGVGALTFVLSQVVHIPLNLIAAKIGSGFGIELPLVALALLLGLSAGVCEEGARWVAFRLIRRRRPAWFEAPAGLSQKGADPAIAHGLGHGGIESILLGLLVALTLLNMVVMRNADTSALHAMGVPDEQVPVVLQQVHDYWDTYWALPLLGAAERLMTIVAHVTFSVLVFRSVASGQRRLLFVAVLWHAALDAAAVYVSQTWGIVIAEGVVLTNAIVCVLVLRRLRGGDAASRAR